MSNLAELIAHLRKDADFVDRDTYDGCWEVKETDRGKRLRAAADAIAALVAERDALFRVVADIAEQRLSGAAIRWHEEEYGDDGEPDFIGAYDIFIQRARAALAQGKP